MNGSTADCDQWGLINATAAGNQVTSFLCPSDTDLANLTYFIYAPGGSQSLVGRGNYPMNGGSNPFRGGAVGASNGRVLRPDGQREYGLARRAIGQQVPRCRTGAVSDP